MSDRGEDNLATDESLLARARRSAGLTQDELAERSGLSVRGIRRLEGGSIERPRRRSLEALAEALGLSCDDRDTFIGHYRGHASAAALGDGPSPGLTVQPAQLPAAPTRFTGRSEHIRRLDEMLEDTGQTVLTVALDGLGGVGKTALATHWAHLRRSSFPDGQLYANLHGYGPLSPVEPTAVVAHFLRSLGLPGEQVAPELDERSALLRSMLADRRMLIVLDNVRTPADVRPLLPGAPGCMVVVTSRDHLRGLSIVDGARRLPVDPLDADEATAMFAELVDGQRLDSNRKAASAIVAHCAGLPLALTIAANRVADAANLSTIAAGLVDDSGSGFQHPGDDAANLESVFSWSVSALDDDAARLFRLLGLHPGPDISPGVAAALAGSTTDTVCRRLDALADAHLLEERHAGRYEFHDLVGRYARRLVESDVPATKRQAAKTRMLDYYLHTAIAAADLFQPLEPHRRPPPGPLAAAAQGTFADREEALAWLESERVNLAAAAEYAVEREGPPNTQHFADVLFRYLLTSAHHDTAVAMHGSALAAACRRGDLGGACRAHVDIAISHSALGRGDLAIDHESQSITLAREIGDRAAEARALANLGGSHLEDCRYRDAIAPLQEALAIAIEDGNEVTEGQALNNLGLAYRSIGQYGEAVNLLLRCLAVARNSGNRMTEARTLMYLGETYRRLEQYDEAAAHLEQALTIAEQVAMLVVQAGVMTDLGKLHLSCARYREARDYGQQALELTRRAGVAIREADALNSLAETEHAVGADDQARAYHREALHIAQRACDPYEEARALCGLAHAIDDPRQAVAWLRESLEIFTRLDAPEAEEVRVELAGSTN